jgi:predicted permease
MKDAMQSAGFRFWLWLIHFIGVMVPRRLRADWQREWQAELYYREMQLAEWDRLDWRAKLDLFWRSLGAFWDALRLQPRRLEDDMFQDLRYGVRMLVNQPGFTLVAVLTLAFGIGVNTAVFTLFNSVALKPLRVKDSKSLVRVYRSTPEESRASSFSYPEFADYRDRNQVFSGLISYAETQLTLRDVSGEGALAKSENLGSADEVEMVKGYLVSGNYFTVLGGELALGRSFLPEEDQTPGTHPVAILSYGFWQRRFGSDSNIVGKTVMLNIQPFTVVGIASQNFVSTELADQVPDVYVPMMMQSQIEPQRRWLNLRSERRIYRLFGRLKPGVSMAQAQAELEVIANQLAQAYPETNEKSGVSLIYANEQIIRDAGFMAFSALVMVAVGLVLLIACANLANLQLARAAMRQKEIAVRLALGASRLRLVRQLLTESTLLACLGGALGMPLAWWITDLTVAAVLARVQIKETLILDVTPDWHVFGYTLLLSLLTGMAFGLAPALQASKPDLTSALKGEGSALGRKLGRNRLSQFLVGAQVAVSLMLLIAAGLLMRGWQSAQTLDLGFETKQILVVNYDLRQLGYDQAKAAQFHRQLVERLQNVVGVKAAALVSSMPLRGGSSGRIPITLKGTDAASIGPALMADYNAVSPAYFEVLGIPLVQGRNFTEQETREGAPVVIVSEATARHFWPGENPLGKQIELGSNAPANNQRNEPQLLLSAAQVIGVAKDTRSVRLSELDQSLVYLPMPSTPTFGPTLLVRIISDPKTAIPALRREAQALDRRLVLSVREEDDILSFVILPSLIGALVSTALGALALLLATIGVYGVVSYAVSQRTREIGIHLALGAQSSDVFKLVLKEGMKPVWIGLMIGLAVSLVIARLMANVLYGISASDPITFLAVPIILAAVALFACYLPAHKAMQVDPMVALRYE